jgi:predicted nicotinamide N-methyase
LIKIKNVNIMERSLNSNTSGSSINSSSTLDKKKLWSKLKNLLMSNEKLKFLNSFTSLELNLFEKENKNEYEKRMKIIYKKLNKNLEDLIDNFQPVEITKPLDEIISQSDNCEKKNNEDILNFYTEKVDNTGNVQIWPCEEILAVYCLLNKNLFKNKAIIELGSGFSGLCALVIAKNIPEVKEVCITDGNSKCIDAVRNNIKINLHDEVEYPFSKVKEKVLLWDRKYLNYEISDKNKYDVILLSDCLFFKNYHIDLVNTIDYLLSENGVCYFVAPPRGNTMDLFIDIAEEKFLVEKSKSVVRDIIDTLKINSKSNFQPFFIQISRK